MLRELPPLQQNYELKQVLLNAYETGKADDSTLALIKEKAKNISAEEDQAIELVLSKIDLHEVTPDARRKFADYRAQEASCRTAATKGWFSRALMLAGGSGLGAGGASAAFGAVAYPAHPEVALIMLHLAAIMGTIYGFVHEVRTGRGRDYGVND